MIAALGVVVAALAAIGTLVQGIRQHRLQARVAELERQRRHGELSPTIRAYETDYAGQDAIKFVNGGPVDYDEVRWSIVRGDEEEPPVVGLAEPGTDEFSRSGSLGRMTLGQDRVRPFRYCEGEPGGIVRFRVTCTAQSEEWVTLVECDVPGHPKVMFV